MSGGFAVQRLTPEIWRWTAPHPEWRPRIEWGHETIEPGRELPGGARAFAIGVPRRREMPLHFPSLRALAFGDAVVGVRSELRVWETLDGGRRTAWYRDRFLPTLGPLVELEPDHVLVTHGPPAIGDGMRKLARALADPPWWHRGS